MRERRKKEIDVKNKLIPPSDTCLSNTPDRCRHAHTVAGNERKIVAGVLCIGL